MAQADKDLPIPGESSANMPPIGAGTDYSSSVESAPAGEAVEEKALDQTNEPAQTAPAGLPHAKQVQSSKRASAEQRPNAKQQKRDSNGQTAARSAAPDKASDVARRLLARFELPNTIIDRALVPPELLGTLDAAGLGSPAVLPAASFMALAAIVTVTGPQVSFLACTDEKLKTILTANGLSLRIALMSEERRSSVVPAAIMAGVYAVENALIGDYLKAVQSNADQRRASAKLRSLHDQATRAASALGIDPPPPFAEDAPILKLARPRIVVPYGASSAIIQAAAGGTGTLLVDDRWVKSMSNVGSNFDEATATLLADLSLGRQIPIADPDGRNSMQAFPACVIGQLTTGDCATLHNAGQDQYAATIFVRAATMPISADNSGLVALMSRVHHMTAEPVALHLSESAQHRLATAATSWTSRAAAASPPLSDFLAGLPDLARRLAAALHIVGSTNGDNKIGAEIPLTAVKRAASIVDTFVMPFAEALLGPLSTAETERDARRMVGYLRERASEANRKIERRPWMRAWQAMPISRFDAALELLQQEKLLVALDKAEGKEGGGQCFEVASVVYNATDTVSHP